MKVAVDMGHTPTSPGASGYLDELTEDRAIGFALCDELSSRGHSVINVTAPDTYSYPDEINYRVNAANASGIDLLVSLHLNAGGGTGAEVLAASSDDYGKNIAAKISANLSSLMGIPDRGVKSGDNIGVISSTNMTAVLVEVCFVDNDTDKMAYGAVSYKAIAKAIADGIGDTESEEDMATPQEIADAVWGAENGETTAYWRLYAAEVRSAQLLASVEALTEAVRVLAGANGADPDAVAKAVSDAVDRKLASIKIEVKAD